jgi:hypothetical protein
MYVEFNELLGKTFKEVSVSGDEIYFETVDGEKYKMYHSQDCCESVYIESVVGDVEDLIGFPILLAEEVVSYENPEGYDATDKYQDSFTWTFYKLATVKGYVDIRWYGESNGYYSESVDLRKL